MSSPVIPYKMHHVRDIVDASSLLRNGIQETPGLTLVGHSVLSIVSFTIAEHPSLICKLGACLRDEGWHLRTVSSPPALQVCLTNAMTVRVHELVKVIREKFFLVIHNHNLRIPTSKLSGSCVTHPHFADLQNVLHEQVLLSHSNAPIFKRYPESSLLMLFGNVCGR